MRTKQERPRKRTYLLAVGALGLAALGLAAALASCNLIDYWADYKDSGENFIAAQAFDTQPLDLVASYETPGLWTWGWGGSGDAANYGYMTLSPQGSVGAGGPAGLSSSSLVYLLGLPNLMPADDGDFETGSFSSDWQYDVGGTSSQTIVAGLHGTSAIRFVLDSNASASFRLNALKDRATAASAQHGYTIRLSYSTLGTLHYSLMDWGSPFIATDAQETLDAATTPLDLALNPIFDNVTLALPGKGLFFGSGSPESATIDDIRVLRKDIVGRYTLRLLLRPSDTTPSLRRGYYEFSVWVKKNPGSSFLTEAGAKNPYAARSVTLTMDQLSPSLLLSHVFPVDGSPDPSTVAFYSGQSHDAAGGWTKLVLRQTGDNTNYTFDNSSASPVIELSVSPTDLTSPDSGEILIAQPELHFYLNGYGN